MNKEVILLALVGIVLILAGTITIITQIQLRRTYQHMNTMLDEAIKGDFKEKLYDESQMSKVSVKLKRFLVTSLLSRNNILQEKEAINALISDISHQTKTPITNILLYTQLLFEDQEISIENRNNLELIMKQSEKLDFLFQTMVKTSRLETGIITLNPDYGLLNRVVLSALEEVQKKADQKNVLVEVRMEEEYYANFDFKWSIEAVYNVLDNAIKYSDADGTVIVSVSDYEMFVRLDITDRGIGIPEEELNKVFQRFYRGREAVQYEGVGIGLYLSRKILMEEGGYIKVSSKPKEGTTFSLFFSKKQGIHASNSSS